MRMPNKDLAIEYIRERLAYDPETGALVWRPKIGTDHQTVAWNAKKAGKVAGTINSRGYLIVSINGAKFLAHRLVWALHVGDWPASLDHIDQDKKNNRLSNLRVATQSQNNWNTSVRRKNASGIKGVTWVEHCQKWRAGICAHRKSQHLGLFSTKEEAAAAYADAARRLHGEFANTGET